MIDSSNQKYDLAIIGSGLAAMAAAVFAVNRGISTVIVGSPGGSWLTGGLIDLMGVHPIAVGNTWDNPWAAIEAVVNDIPGHPYARMEREDIKTGLQEFYSILNGAGLPYCFRDDRNSNLVTAFGMLKTTHGVPQTMWPGVQAFKRKASCLVVDIQGLKGFSANLPAERLKSQWPGLKTLSIGSVYGEQVHEINPVPLAHDLEIAEYRQKLAGLIRPHIRDVEFVGLPAILGIYQADTVASELSKLLEREVFEIPAMPPSIPGLRLKEALLRLLPEKGVSCLFQKQILNATSTARQGFSLDVGRTESELTISADGVLLASGRFLGGGLISDHLSIKEPIFDLPVTQPEHRKCWHMDRFFDSGGHPVNMAGLETDSKLRPLNGNGNPKHELLFAAGSILAHHDGNRMKCGSGVSVATAYGAVKSFSRLHNIS
jgi:glycerol-3-phosphate dehydrogenase subunit B